MKKILCVCALLTILLFSGCAEAPQFNTYRPQSTLNPESGLKQWSTNDYSIVLTYPHTWFANTDISAVVQLLSPLADATPDYREYIIIGVMQPKEGDTAVSVADAAWLDMKEMFPSIELEKNEAAAVAGMAMQLRVFGGHIPKSDIGPEGDYLWYQYSWLSGGLSYSITFSATKDTLKDYLPVFQYVLDNMTLNT